MDGQQAIEALKKKFRIKTDADLGKKLGVSVANIQLWKKKADITERQLAEMVSKAVKAGADSARVNAIRPIVEYARLESAASRSRASRELFSVDGRRGPTNRFFAGLRQDLEQKYGIYIFFDSRGRAIYVGKARRQSLWREMRSAFNRDRKELQSIKRVKHPKNREYLSGDSRSRQITETFVSLHELSAYVSAYEVELELIDDLEALLVRSFANDLLNKKMERFVKHRTRRGNKLVNTTGLFYIPPEGDPIT